MDTWRFLLSALDLKNLLLGSAGRVAVVEAAAVAKPMQSGSHKKGMFIIFWSFSFF